MHRRSLWLGLLNLGVALAPAPQDPPAPAQAPAAPVSLADFRVQAGVKAYDTAWLYLSENRIGIDEVYRWSRRLLEAQREANPEKASQVAACEGHLERMKKLEFKVVRTRRIGFSNTLEVVGVDYYCKEAEFWLALAREAK
jgi:hypothetical protein